jgi:hypothetical protein
MWLYVLRSLVSSNIMALYEFISFQIFSLMPSFRIHYTDLSLQEDRNSLNSLHITPYNISEPLIASRRGINNAKIPKK